MMVLAERTGAAILVGLAATFGGVTTATVMDTGVGLLGTAGEGVTFFVVLLVGFVDFMFYSVCGSILPRQANTEQ